MIIYRDIEQKSPVWFAVRAGIPTASSFSDVLAKGKGKEPSKVRATYMRKLAGEIITGQPNPGFENDHTRRGNRLEPEALAAVAFVLDVEPEPVGFIRGARAGASPDALVGSDGLIEIKTKLPHLQIDVLENGVVPPEHIPQIQGQLWIAEREWCWFASYWPGLPIFLKKVYRDEDYIFELSGQINRFHDELHALVDKYRNQGAFIL